MSTKRVRLPDEVIKGGNYLYTKPVFVPYMGNQGVTGLVGPTGVQGVTGLFIQVGIQGSTGVQGVQGDVGSTGIQGISGGTGIDGRTGIMGHTGLGGGSGNQGATGIRGMTGIAGLQGVTGFYGQTGIQGIIGLKGHTGLQGIQGDTGIQGNTGITGRTGIQGIGIQGVTGLQGSPGSAGIVGPGTPQTIAMFTPDASSIGDSKLVEDEAGSIIYNRLVTNAANASSFQVRSDSTFGACLVQCVTQGTISSDISLDLMAVGGSFYPGSTSGPNGATQDNGVIIQGTGAAFMDISVGQGRDGTTSAGHLTHAYNGVHTTMLTWDQTGVGIHNQTPAGIFHPHYDTSSNAQLGINCNVGPSGVNCSSDASTGMVEFRDTILCGTAADGTSQIAFRLPPADDMGLVGHLDLHVYNTNDGESRYGHFSIRFFNEGAQSITRDYGDSTYLNIGDTGEGARLIWSDSGAPYFAPVFNIKVYNSLPNAPYQLDYHMFLRKVTYPA